METSNQGDSRRESKEPDYHKTFARVASTSFEKVISRESTQTSLTHILSLAFGVELASTCYIEEQ